MITFKAKTPQGEIINSALTAFTFPAGEAHIKREDRRSLEQTEIAILQFEPETMHDDLFQLAMWNEYLLAEDLSIKRVLVMPYFPGARADRGNPFGASVYADFIGKMYLYQTIIFDPHSYTIVEQFDNTHGNPVTVVGSDSLWGELMLTMDFLPMYDGIIAPDKGAIPRAQAVADVFRKPLYVVDKARDFETGKLKINSVPDLYFGGRYLVIDDICDGGGTFMMMAKELENKIPGFSAESSLDLYVSHGVFSKGALSDLPYYFAQVYTTNSFLPSRKLPKGFERFDIIRELLQRIL